ncbi:MAG: L-seryl-tRNA(Sec) selenium transferase [bacterium]
MLSELQNTCLRSIPSVESILTHELIRDWLSSYPRWVLVEGIRKVLDLKREWILSRQRPEELEGFRVSRGLILEELSRYLRYDRCSELVRVINGTGVILHTNLGRAVLAAQAVENLGIVASGYSSLEFDLSTGKRGKRGWPVTRLLCHASGAEDALVVNNNAAGVLLVLNTLAESRQVIVSRGELVEIGGSFRVPEIIRKGGARLVEVGTTNKTRIEDYRQAVTLESAAILKVHPSNFRIMGFTEEASLKDLVLLGKERGLVVIYDLGSGMLVDLSPYGLEEPLVSRIVQEGLDIVTFSGDKLLGGPQAGIILCKKKYAGLLRKNPLFRALRPDKMTLAALESTLRLYQSPAVLHKVPTLAMITISLEALYERGRRILTNTASAVQKHSYDGGPVQDEYERIRIELVDDDAQVGGGAFPMQAVSSLAVAVSVSPGGINELEEQFRLGHPPILGRIHKGRFLLNLRTIQEEDMPELIRAMRQVFEYWGSKEA